MPRHHTISYPRQWVVETELEPAHWQESYQEDVEFTPEEETARDIEVAAGIIMLETRRVEKVRLAEARVVALAKLSALGFTRDERVATLEAKLADDSITFNEMKELMRLRG
jgi:hypothetical protein